MRSLERVVPPLYQPHIGLYRIVQAKAFQSNLALSLSLASRPSSFVHD